MTTIKFACHNQGDKATSPTSGWDVQCLTERSSSPPPKWADRYAPGIKGLAIDWDPDVFDVRRKFSTVVHPGAAKITPTRGGIELRIVTEKTPGLIFARQKGVEKACFEFVLFCDDDNWLAENYLSVAYKAISKNSRMGALGGTGFPVFEGKTSPPSWFQQIRNAYALGPQASKTGVVPKQRHLYGAGMVTRRQVYIDSYPASFPSLMKGRVGSSLLSGEDTEYCHRLRLQNYDIHYHSGLVFNHYISQERLTPEYKTRLLKGTEEAQMELRRFTLLIAILSSRGVYRFLFVFKIAAGFISAKAFGRNSWNYLDVIRSIYFLTQINLGIDKDSKHIYQYYKSLG